MRITRQDATELLLEDSGKSFVAFGAFFVVFSAISGHFVLRDGKGWLGLLIVCVFAIAGLVMIARARAQTHYWDLRHGRLTISSRPTLALFGTTTEVVEYPLDSVQDVVLEESTSGGAGQARTRTYRLAYLFADGQRRPLRPYYTSGRGGYASLQESLRSALARVRRG